MLLNQENITATAVKLYEAISKADDDATFIEVDEIVLIKFIDGENSTSLSNSAYVLFVGGKRQGVLYLPVKPETMEIVRMSLARLIGELIKDKVESITSHILCGGEEGMPNPTYVTRTLSILKRRESSQAIKVYQVIVNGKLVANVPHEGAITENDWIYICVRNIIHSAAMDGEYHLTVLD